MGSNDNYVDFFAANEKYKHLACCKGASSFITHIDFSVDGAYIQVNILCWMASVGYCLSPDLHAASYTKVNSGAKERLFFSVPSGKRVVKQDEIDSIQWVSWTSVLGDEVNGIWPKYAHQDDINACEAIGDAVVTGDDFGCVKLFRFPCTKAQAKARTYTGHSSHVTNVRSSYDQRRVVTTGGADNSVFVWRFVASEAHLAAVAKIASLDAAGDTAAADRVANATAAGVEAEDEETDASSDSDASDCEEVDSDIEREALVDYSREEANTKETLANIKLERLTAGAGKAVKRDPGPDQKLQLHRAHGYRGYDCRDNIFFTAAGELVYHVGLLYHAIIMYHSGV